MRKHYLLKTMLLLCALIVGSSSAWAEDETITAKQFGFTSNTNLTGTNATLTATNFTLTFAQNESTTVPAYNSSNEEFRLYKIASGKTNGATITIAAISENVTFNKVVFEFNNLPNNYSFSSGSYTASTNTWTGDATSSLTLTNTDFSGQLKIKSMTITYQTASSSGPSISASDVNIAYNAEEGEIAYTINNPVEGGELTASTEDSWIVPDDATASTVPFICDTNDGAKRTATITLTYTYDTDKTVTKNVTVTQAAGPNAPGTENNPYTVAQARAAIDAGTDVNAVYATGYVSTTGIVNSGAINYYISSDGSKTDQLEAYKGKGIDGADFTSADDIQLGDLVVIKGNLKKYNSTYEFDAGNQLVSLKRIQMIDLIKDCPLTFIEGSEFNHDGLKVIAIYEDESTLDVTALSEIEEPDMTKIGPQTVLVNYGMFQTGYEITITEKPTHTATFSVNGTTSTNDFKEGTDIEFPEVTAPTGYTFMGWTETELTEPQATAPDYITLPVAMGTGDVTYYAVFAKATEGGDDTYEKLTSNSFDANATYVIAGTQNASSTTVCYLQSYSSTNEDISWGIATTTPATVTPITFTLSGTASELVAKDNSGNYLTCITVKKFAMSSTSTTVYLDENGDIKSASDGNYLRYNYNTGNGGFRWYAGQTTGTQAYFYKVIPGTTYSDYCTTVPPVEITISAVGWASFSNASEVQIPEGVTAYYAQKKDDATVTLKEITGGYIPANTGVVVSGGANTYEATVTTTGATLEEDNLLKPWLTAGEPEETTDYYTLAVNSENKPVFKKSTGGTLAAGKAYLVMPAGAGARELNVSFDEEGNTTGVADINRETITNNGSFFDLQGRKVANPTKGLYIVNGKKVVK